MNLQRLRSEARQLARENRLLREELTETTAELNRLRDELHPLPPGLAYISRGPGLAPPPPADESDGRKRRWRRPEA